MSNVSKIFPLRQTTLITLKGWVQLCHVLQHKRMTTCLPLIHPPSQPSPDVLFETKSNKGIMILNRPLQSNVINASMLEKMGPTLQNWGTNRTHIIVQGAGGRAFCAGVDMLGVTKEFFNLEYRMIYTIGKSTIPYIAYIDGITKGGGAGLSVHAQYRIATERSVFAVPDASFGFFPDVGRSYFLSRLEGNLGHYLAMTGHQLKGKDLVKAGIATHFCESKNWMCVYKKIIDMQNQDREKEDEMLMQWTENIDYHEFSLAPHLNRINDMFSACSVEELFEKLAATNSPWANETLHKMKKMSPTSLKITKKGLDYGAELELDECLKMEYRMACCVLSEYVSKDFHEGVQAIRKSRKPKWDPIELDKVDDAKVEYGYFGCLPRDQELVLC